MLYIKGQGMVEGDPLEKWAPWTIGQPMPVQATTRVVTFQAEGEELQVVLDALVLASVTLTFTSSDTVVRIPLQAVKTAM